MFFADILKSLWSKFPWWMKGYFILVTAPTLIILAIIFYFLFIPWQAKSIHATIIPYEQKRDVEITTILLKQEFKNQTTNDSLKRIEQHQGMIFAELIRRNNP